MVGPGRGISAKYDAKHIVPSFLQYWRCGSSGPSRGVDAQCDAGSASVLLRVFNFCFRLTEISLAICHRASGMTSKVCMNGERTVDMPLDNL
jgi:hypothetical protein